MAVSSLVVVDGDDTCGSTSRGSFGRLPEGWKRRGGSGRARLRPGRPPSGAEGELTEGGRDRQSEILADLVARGLLHVRPVVQISQAEVHAGRADKTRRLQEAHERSSCASSTAIAVCTEVGIG
jgi:hypothetical protein